MAFNRNSGGRGGDRGGFRPRPSFGGGRGGFGGRGGRDRGPVEMHDAICDNCGKSCEVPFRPTSGKPIFCSNCFEGKRGTDTRRNEGRNFDRPTNFEDRQMFDAVCDECRNACKVPFQPSGGKPIYCSNCFGEKKGAGGREQSGCQSQCIKQFEQLNNKLDKILMVLAPNAFKKEAPVATE